MSNDFAKDLDALIQKIHPGTAQHHDKLNSLEHVMRAEYDGLFRHMDHVRATALMLHEEAAARLTDVAKAMGYIPALPPPIQQMQIPEDMPRVARTRAEQTVESIYGHLERGAA